MAAQGPTQLPRGTGNAPIVKTGHTANDQHGSNVNAKPKGRKSTRDLNIK
jgi:hypothetical protein